MNKKTIAPAPLYRDPIFDCPTDPVVIRNHVEQMWYLFYTQRRAGSTEIGVSWVHGTKIGVATSKDGRKWLYRGTLKGLDIEPGHNTFWAPEIVYELGQYHMYVTYITGIPTDWNEKRRMLHYTSMNLWDWKYERELNLGSERVIDACIYKVADETYKMWYKDECNHSYTTAAISKDLYDFKVTGVEVDDCPQEGANVFELGGKIWMISDYWKGLAVYTSKDYLTWKRCPDILDKSGTRNMDVGFGHHADVVVFSDRAYIFYFCHPYANECNEKNKDNRLLNPNMAVVQVAELKVKGEALVCSRNEDVDLSI